MATIHDVAKKAGVSTATVSHVINNTRPVSEELTNRVFSIIEELNYKPNIIAKSLRKGNTHTIALILPDNTNPFFAEIGQAIEIAAYESGYSLILCNTGGSKEKELEYIELLIQTRVDGVVFCGVGNEQQDTIESLLSAFNQVVIIDDFFPTIDAANIVADNRNGGYIATKHLLDLGHTRIACIKGPSDESCCDNRFFGYKDALQEAGIDILPELVSVGDWYPESGRFLFHKMMEMNIPPTAIFSCNDLMAFGVIRAAYERNISIPNQLALVGFDDIQLSTFATPSLSSISQPKNEIGRIAIEIIVEKIKTGSINNPKIILPVNLMIRQSCGGSSTNNFQNNI